MQKQTSSLDSTNPNVIDPINKPKRMPKRFIKISTRFEAPACVKGERIPGLRRTEARMTRDRMRLKYTMRKRKVVYKKLIKKR